jgi:hypothetical protein
VAAAEFDIPEIKESIEIPKLREGVMSHAKSFLAPKPVQDYMGYPHEQIGRASCRERVS